jgi:hypothetical protein
MQRGSERPAVFFRDVAFFARITEYRNAGLARAFIVEPAIRFHGRPSKESLSQAIARPRVRAKSGKA